MITIYDSETIIKIYRLLSKKCAIIDKFIENHAYYFGPTSAEYGAEDVCNNIIELMTRKNQLINLKLIVDSALNTLNDRDKKVLYIKMHYNISINEICGILNIKDRTAFRYLEQAYEHFADALNNSRYINKLERIMREEGWIQDATEEVKSRRQAYKSSCSSCASI